MERIKEFVTREVVTDGDFVYNTGYILNLKDNTIEKEYYDTVLIGVIENRERVELPEKFCSKKIVCINPLKVYKFGNKLNLAKNKITKIPLKSKPKMWYTFEGTLPDDDYLIEVPNTIKEVCLGNASLKFNCFKNSSVEGVFFKKSPAVIPEECFAECQKLKKCVFPAGVKKIGYRAFMGCSSLKNVNLPDSITNICEMAFFSTGLEYIVLPQGVERIKKLCFGNCVNLQMVIIPPSVKYIHPKAFYGSPNVILTSVKNSAVEKFAYENNIPFLSIENVTGLYKCLPRPKIST